MIKYLGSKRLFVKTLGDIATAVEASTALDLFTGTTRVAQEFKKRGILTTAVDVASYSDVLAGCYISTDARDIDELELDELIKELNALPGYSGYFTETFCIKSRFFQPKNGMRVDAIREYIKKHHRRIDPLFPILMTSLMLAADKVDSTCGTQMAYLKKWASRSYKDMVLKRPDLLPGKGYHCRKKAEDFVYYMPSADLMYLDPPYNQHRYFTNYHIWETLVRWDKPEHYGVACKRKDSRYEDTKSVFNKKKKMSSALRDLLVDAVDHTVGTAVVSYNNESWITSEQMVSMLRYVGFKDVRILAFDNKRYVGAQIGIFNPSGEKVGEVSHLKNTEYMFIAGDTDRVEAAVNSVSILE